MTNIRDPLLLPFDEDPLEGEEPPTTVFTPPEWIAITSDGGNIGRICWVNQLSCRAYTYAVLKGYHYEVPGHCAFLGTLGDFWKWLLSP